MILALVLGIALGFISAVPIAGPVSALIFSRGMEGKFAQGVWIAVGSGLIEGTYAFIACFGFTRFLSNLNSIYAISNAVTAILLACLGVFFFRSKQMRKPQDKSKKIHSHGKRAFLEGLGISAVNPSIIAMWTLVVTTIYRLNPFQFTLLNSILFCFGIAFGIVVWFSLLMKILARHRQKVGSHFLDKILKGMGLLLSGLSLFMTYRFVVEVS